MLAALVAGYAVGSIPVGALVARAAGLTAGGRDDPPPDAADVWRAAGSGWGMLAVSGDLATGILPVAIGAVTWSWAAGAAAGIGALAGAGLPAPGRSAAAARGSGRRRVAVLSGVAYAMAPAAGTLALVVALVAALAARAIGWMAGATRAAMPPAGRVALAGGLVAYPLLFLAAAPDPLRLVAVGALYGAALVLRFVPPGR